MAAVVERDHARKRGEAIKEGLCGREVHPEEEDVAPGAVGQVHAHRRRLVQHRAVCVQGLGDRALATLDLPVVEALAPYGQQIDLLNTQIGATLPRQPMKDASSASQMDPKTQVTSLYGVSMLDAAQYPLEANVSLALLHEAGGENDRKLINVAIGAEVNLHGDAALAAGLEQLRLAAFERRHRVDDRNGGRVADAAGEERVAGEQVRHPVGVVVQQGDRARGVPHEVDDLEP